MTIENVCYFLVPLESLGEPSTLAELKKSLEKGDENEKIDTMKKILIMMSNGDPCSELLMHIIRFIAPEKNKLLKKLLLLYYEACEKIGSDGKLKQEMILVCNALRNDLQHSNEYVRGSTLRFLIKLKEAELLEPLIPSVRLNLEHRHSYVRRNAIIAIAAIQKEHPHLIPDAPELIFDHIQKETDMHCKRLALFSLTRINLILAVAYFKQVVNNIETLDEPLQQAILDMIRTHGPHCTNEKPMYLQATLAMLSSSTVSNMIKYECASVLTSLSTNPIVFKAASNCYIEIILKESDNNVKLIVLDRISDLYYSQPHILQYSLGDLLKVLYSSDLAVIKKGLSIIVENITLNNANETVEHLKKELEKTIDESSDNIMEYRQLLISALCKCAFLSDQLASNVIATLILFISDKNAPYLMDCIQFFKLTVNKFPSLKMPIVESLFSILTNIKSSRILRSSFWIIGEHSENIPLTIERIEKYLNDITEAEAQHNAIESTGDTGSPDNLHSSSGAPKILPDGTYASESAFTPLCSGFAALSQSKKNNSMRSVFFENGNIYVPASLAMTLVKLLARVNQMGLNIKEINRLKAKSMLILVNAIKLISNSSYKEKLNTDSFERLSLCLRILASPDQTHELSTLFEHSLDIFKTLSSKYSFFDNIYGHNKSLKNGHIAPDTMLSFNCLKSSSIKVVKDDQIVKEIKLITEDDTEGNGELSSRLDRVYALTAISDNIYAEAYIDIQDLDVKLDVILINQTQETFQNVCFEFISTGGNRSLYKPIQAALGPYSFLNAKTDFKVHSAEQIIIQGSISFDPNPHMPLNFVLFNTISLDITHFLQSKECSESDFANLWRILEWENKIHIKTHFKSFNSVIKELCKITNFKLLSEMPNDDTECEVFSANLFALSKFGEEVLANVSLEKNQGKVSGHVRIRSRSNGIAYILGTKISQKMGSL